jgi:hypothetical protein
MSREIGRSQRYFVCAPLCSAILSLEIDGRVGRGPETLVEEKTIAERSVCLCEWRPAGVLDRKIEAERHFQTRQAHARQEAGARSCL